MKTRLRNENRLFCCPSSVLVFNFMKPRVGYQQTKNKIRKQTIFAVQRGQHYKIDIIYRLQRLPKTINFACARNPLDESFRFYETFSRVMLHSLVFSQRHDQITNLDETYRKIASLTSLLVHNEFIAAQGLFVRILIRYNS